MMKKRFDSIQDKCIPIVDYIMGCSELPLYEEFQVKYRLCAEEAVQNIISYAYDGLDGWMEVEVRWDRDERALITRLSDGGKPFDPTTAQEPDLSVPLDERKIGGLGIHFYKFLMDKVEYSYENGCNVLTMKKILHYSPLSQSQMGIWFACSAHNDEKSNYQIPFLYKLPDSVDLERLKKALESVCKAHPYINSHICMVDGEPVMVRGLFKEIPIRKVKDINSPELHFGKPMDLLRDIPVRLEIYSTPDGNYFFQDFHHIIYDGSSHNVLMDDIRDAYEGKPLQMEQMDGAAVALEEKKMRESDEYGRQKEWYLKEFGAAQELDSLPSPSSIAADCSEEGKAVEVSYTLDIDDDRVTKICEKYNVGKSVAFTAAWGKMLADFTAEERAFFTTIYNGRNSEACKRTVTMMVHTLPVYVELESSRKLQDVLSELSRRMAGARKYDAYSFSDIHQDLGLRDDILFAYQGSLVKEGCPLTLDKDTIKCKDLRTVRSGTILDAQLFKDDKSYSLRVSYDTHRYSEAMIESMAESFASIMKSMLESETVSELAVCSARQEEYLDSLNKTPNEEYFHTKTVMEYFKEMAAKGPERIFCVFKERKYSYALADRITDGLAYRIKDAVKGNGSTPVVSIVSGRDEWMCLMPLAAVKAGCTYQPLDPGYPVERLEYMVQDSSSSLLLCTSEYSGLVPSMKDRILCVEDPMDFAQSEPMEYVPAAKDDTFILIYTSGTTGKPKGVQISQGNIASFTFAHVRARQLDCNVRYASYASSGFDAFMMDLWSVATSGGALYIIGEDIRYDLAAIRDYFVSEGITHAFMTTQVATQMAVEFPDIPNLKEMGTGGEKLGSIQPPKYGFINMYGPTEATVYTNFYKVEALEQNVPIGHASGATHLYVVSKSGKRLPKCAAGELWVSGPQVSKGYLNLPEKTAAVFTPNPFAKPSEKDIYPTVYHTGDIVRYREDGEVEFIGRRDGQVKIRGFRIELKEVEAIIADFPGIKAVTVQAFDLPTGGKALAAYIVSEGKIDIKELNSFIMSEKPSYMVPAVTMQIDSIPLNVNGKVDRKKLPEPKINVNEGNDSPAVPLNLLEQELCDMVCKLASCEPFGVTVPLSRVGLSSITSLKLSVQLYKKYGISVDIKSLNHDATLQSIENQILESLLTKTDNKDSSEAPAINAREEKNDSSQEWSAPLSNAQNGVYLECLKNPASTVYNIPQAIIFPDSVSTEQIKAATERALEMHPVLFAHIDSGAESAIQRAPRSVKALVEISSKGVEELKKDFVRPFDLEHGPLYRAVISGHTLLLDAHHLALDGSSLSILLHQICDIIEGRSVEAEKCSFFDYAAKEQTEDRSTQEEFFTKTLSTIDEAGAFPADLHGDEAQGHACQVALPVDSDAVALYAKERGITPASVYLAALQYLLARYSGTNDVCLCTVSSGRGRLEISDTVGMFVNTLALASHITDCSVEEFVAKSAENFRQTIENENYPFALIAEKFGISPQLVFVYQVGVVDKFEVAGKAVGIETFGVCAPKFKCTLIVEEREGKVNLVSEYNDALYSKDYMSRMLESLAQVLSNMISKPEAPLRKLSIISASQAKELEGMRHTGDLALDVQHFHKGIERWAQSDGNHTAVIACDAVLSYRELDSQANRIAHSLIERGLKIGDAVVVLLPRRSTTISCVLGIMKAGGAFIPCDPEYPSERIRLIAEDSGAPFVVTTENLVSEYPGRGVVIDSLLSSQDESDPKVDIKPDDLAYMIYTSGSTGRPKGVCVAHRNICVCLTVDERNPYYNMVCCEKICSVFTISFDAFIFEMGHTLFHGRTFVFADEKQSKDPIALVELMKREKVDYFGSTSSRMLQYLELPEFVECVERLSCTLQGGEKFSDSLLKRLQKINPRMSIVNGYGPTEVAISCNAAELKGAPCVTVGKPLANYTEWILDCDGNELPVGVAGELCAGGPGITLGYRNLPEKTAEKFIEYGGMRAFKTGDFARWMSDGQVEILGRTDNQVKLRGLRIELGEVESAIAGVEGVKNVLVKICAIQGTDHLSAYYVADRKIEPSELKAQIGTTLTAYMVPDAYLQMDFLPITPNGKVDFRHLPLPELVQTEREYVAPANDAEQFFADTFADILSMDKVGATDSFFELGGTSLIVMKVVIVCQKAGYNVTYADIFANPTPRKLSAFIGRGSTEEEDPDADVRDFDYESLESTLARNTLSTFLSNDTRRGLGDILLTGATGFLGIHVFAHLLKAYPNSRIYCLLRSRKDISAKDRLLQMFFYYFEQDIREELEERVTVFEGDTTKPISLDAHIDTVINCAALVKHFAKGSQIEEVNVGSVRNCIDFCLKCGARLIQISTYSVGGSSVNGNPGIKAFTENMLYKGQRIANQYVHSKIMGERLILDAVKCKGLDAKIMRVGNLSARSQDGEFQINVKANSFMGRLKVYQMLGAIPYSAFSAPVEFSPIDQTAQAICLLAQTNSSCTVFHPYNNHSQMLGDVVDQMETLGKEIRFVEDKEFVGLLDKAKNDPSCQEDLSAMLAYEGRNDNFTVQVIPPGNDFTFQVLLRLGFKWNTTSWDYMRQFFHQIDSLNFFKD